MKYLIALDLDDTLLNHQSQVSKKSIEVISQLRQLGHTIVLATGRPFYGALRIYNELNLDSLLITDNGGLISNPSNKDFKPIKRVIPLSSMHEIFKAIKGFIVSALYTDGNKTYAYKYSDELEYVFNGILNPVMIEGDFDTFDKEPTSIILCTDSFNNEAFERVINDNFNHLVGLRFWGNSNNLGFYEIHLNDVSKASALKGVLDYYQISNDNLIALGDGVNDLEMIKLAYIGVAMQNAHPKLKELAKYITKLPNDQDGAALFLEDLLLK